jgi:hypothetical protein
MTVSFTPVGVISPVVGTSLFREKGRPLLADGSYSKWVLFPVDSVGKSDIGGRAGPPADHAGRPAGGLRDGTENQGTVTITV